MPSSPTQTQGPRPRGTLRRAAPLALAACAALAAGPGLPGAARANPFTLEPRRLALDVSFIFDMARNQWDVLGRYGPFSVNGQFTSQSVWAGLRYGIVEGLEAQLRAGYKVASYRADSFHLFPVAADRPSVAQLTDGVIDISGQEYGVGDIYAGLSYRPYARRVNLAVEAELKIPTGYRAPSGTLCANLTPEQTIDAVVRTVQNPAAPAVRPADFCSGSTLGDGQVDLLALLQLGKYIPQTRTFLRVDAGMNFRFQGPGQQAVAQVKLGENLFDVVFLTLGARLAYTVNTGEDIGTTINSKSPLAPARDYPGDLFLYDPARRDRSYLLIDAGVIWRITQAMELRGSYSRALWGRNFPEINSVALGFAALAL